MTTTKLTIPPRRQSSHQSSIEPRPSISWNRRTEVFKVSESGSIQLGPEEDEIEKIYGQIHHLMETLNEKFGLTVKKKEDNCLIAFKKVMKSIEKDLTDIKQQVEESKKVTRDSDENQTIDNLQKQLNFFRDESLTLTKKLKVAEKTIRDLTRRNKQLEMDIEQEHRMLVKSEKERKALKSAAPSSSTTPNLELYPEISPNSSPMSSRRVSNLANEWHENKELSEIRSASLLELGSISDRKTRSISCRNIESKYKKDSLQINSLREQLDQILKKRVSFLNTDKIDELVSIVTSVVSRRLQAQEQQIGAQTTKILKLKQYYQYLLRTQSGTELPFGLDEILFVFWDMFTVYKIKEKGESLGKISARGTERELNRQNMLNYRHSVEPNKPDRNAVLDLIRNGNKKFSQLSRDEKIKMMQMLLDDPIVDGLLDHYSQAMKFQRKTETTLAQQLAKIKATGSYPQTPVATDLLPSDDDEEKVIQEPIFKEDFFFARARNQQIAASQGVNSINTTHTHTHGRSLSLVTKYQSPDFGGESTLPIHSFGDHESPDRKDTSPVWITGRGLETRNNPFEKEESVVKAEVSFSTPRGFTKEATEEETNREIKMPVGDEKGKKDFRRKFLVKNGKINGNGSGNV